MLHAQALAYVDLTDATADDVAEMHEVLARNLEDLSVQVRLLHQGPWHRKAIGGLVTACGKHVDFAHDLGRLERYEDALCTDGCFSQYELELAEHNNRERDKKER